MTAEPRATETQRCAQRGEHPKEVRMEEPHENGRQDHGNNEGAEAESHGHHPGHQPLSCPGNHLVTVLMGVT